jgi:hypothetical protein
MGKKFTLIYLAIAPLVFGLSWYISHRLFMNFAAGEDGNGATDRSLIYAGVFTGIYLAVLLVIRDLYRPAHK